eukprot:TRINITY_DN15109_c0_g1_i1.p1 TRINITY_DN15109_c0_g1~~TRINITY_DN15109_c0_g1_i1.p1  ORF type:complete len:110 (+),score=22.00 TRINITY_DN15109_c0_g1_i1:156-485(+)
MSDVYSFGMLLWQVCLGGKKLPFNQLTEVQIHNIVVNGVPIDDTSGCPKALVELIRRCIMHDPQKRPTLQVIQTELKAMYDSLFLPSPLREVSSTEALCNIAKLNTTLD